MKLVSDTPAQDRNPEFEPYTRNDTVSKRPPLFQDLSGSNGAPRDSGALNGLSAQGGRAQNGAYMNGNPQNGASQMGSARTGNAQTGNDQQISTLDERISSIDSLLNNFINKFSYIKRDITYNYPEDIETQVLRLIESQVREEIAHELAKEAESIRKRQPDTPAREIFEHLINEQLGAAQPIQPRKFQQKIILLVGPTGVGKTTTLVKLAAEFTVKGKKRVGIINTDTYRIAAQQQLKTYADILSIPLGVAYQETELEQAIQDMEDRDIIFIDTAGKRPGDEQHKKDILDIIKVASPEDVLLCVAAPTAFASLMEIVDTYNFIDNYRFVVTKVDETRYRGMVLNLSWYAGKALAYATTGQNVPDDIEVINSEDITAQILGER